MVFLKLYLMDDQTDTKLLLARTHAIAAAGVA